MDINVFVLLTFHPVVVCSNFLDRPFRQLLLDHPLVFDRRSILLLVFLSYRIYR
jgi:hypothetical protein